MHRTAITFAPVLLAGLLLASGEPSHAASALETGAPAQTISAPEPVSPSDGATVTGFGPTLRWSLPPGSTQYQLQVIPVNNDGPGVNLIIGSPGESYTIPAPPAWYGLLPDMTYTWRLRASDATAGLSEDAPDWGPWSVERTFRTPVVSSSSISLESPAAGAIVSSTTPVLVWSSSRPDLYYYEVQVSRDPNFGPGDFLYWELRHGGVTAPPNSYAIPAEYPLETDTTYYWRVRPRVQGDGTPVEWTPASSFTTRSAQGNVLLEVTSPADGDAVTTATVLVTGRTRVGAFVTVNEVLATVDASGVFRATVGLQRGPNELEIIATDLNGNTARVSITVTYLADP